MINGQVNCHEHDPREHAKKPSVGPKVQPSPWPTINFFCLWFRPPSVHPSCCSSASAFPLLAVYSFEESGSCV